MSAFAGPWETKTPLGSPGYLAETVQLCLVGPHPHIVRLLDAGWQGNVPCIVFEQAAGSLTQFVQKRRGEVDCMAESRQLLAGIAAGLAHVHTMGLVHVASPHLPASLQSCIQGGN